MSRVTVMGDPMLDVWHDYVSRRTNPEDASTKVVQHASTKTHPGGALNVARNCAQLGLHTTFLNTITLTALEQTRLDSVMRNSSVHVVGSSPNVDGHHLTRKRRIRVDGKLLYRLDEDNPPRSTLSLSTIISTLQVSHADVLVLTDYEKGTLWPPTTTIQLLERRDEYFNPLIILDAKPSLIRCLADKRLLGGAHVKCNEAEWNMLGISNAHAWVLQHGVAALYVTNGARGVFIATVTGTTVGAGHSQHGKYNVCGAGDVFTAALVRELLDPDVRSSHFAGQRAAREATAAVHSGQRETLLVEAPEEYDE